MITHDTFFNQTYSDNATSPILTSTNTISWQSAFWPLVACALNVMLQSTGRVCGAHYRDSYALRSSPFVGTVDTLLMLLKFVCMLAVGCQFRVAAMHVWYDRFQPEDDQAHSTFELLANLFDRTKPYKWKRSIYSASTINNPWRIGTNPNEPEPSVYRGSSIDNAWRLSMVVFVLGTLPQTIKVFGMRGIPLTQTLVGCFLFSFLIPEIFRLIAGHADAVCLRPMPIVVRAKESLAILELKALLLACAATWVFLYGCIIALAFKPSSGMQLEWRNEAVLFIWSLSMAYSATQLLVLSIYGLWKLAVMLSSALKIQPSGMMSRNLRAMGSVFKTKICCAFAIRPPFVGFGLRYGIALTLALPVYVLTMHLCSHYEIDWGGRQMTIQSTLLFFMSLIPAPVLLAVSYAFFRLVFMGSLSRYPRFLLGLKGTSAEFYAGAFVLVNLVCAVVGYAYHESFPENTFKPIWAEYLG